MSKIDDLKSKNNESFDEYYKKFIKPSSQYIDDYETKILKAKKISKRRRVFNICLCIFILLIFGEPIFKAILADFDPAQHKFYILNGLFQTFITFLLGLVFIVFLKIFEDAPLNKINKESTADIIPKILGFFGQNLTFKVEPSDNTALQGWEEFEIFKKTRVRTVSLDYSITGQIDKETIDISKVSITEGRGKNSRDIFTGWLMKIERDNNFVTQKVNIKQIKKSNKIEVSPNAINDSDFEIIYENDSQENRNFVAESDLLKLLRNLSDILKTKIDCEIIDNKLLILVENEEDDYFEITSDIKKSYFYDDSVKIANVIAGFLSFTKISPIPDAEKKASALSGQALSNSIELKVNQDFEEYYQKFIKPSFDLEKSYDKLAKKAERSFQKRVGIILLITGLAYFFLEHFPLFSIYRMFENLAANSTNPQFNNFLGHGFSGFVILIMLFAVLVFIYNPMLDNAKSLKSELLSKLLGIFDDSLIYSNKKTDGYLIEKNILSFYSLQRILTKSRAKGEAQIEIEDLIYGDYQNHKIYISQLKIKKGNVKNSQKVFGGWVIIAESRQILSSQQIIFKYTTEKDEKSSPYAKFKFDEDSKDNENSIISFALLEYTKKLSKFFKTDNISYNIFQNKILMIIPNNRISFDIAMTMPKPYFYKDSKKIIDQLSALLEIVNVIPE